MANLIDQIHTDHRNMARLLSLIDEEIDKLIAEKLPDFLMLEHAMRYMVSYADKVHHPKEDALFERMATTDSRLGEAVDGLTAEHRHIVSLGEHFYDLIRAAQTTDFVRRDDMISEGIEYVAALRAHIHKEEADLLKRAQALFTVEELEDVDKAVESAHDPLFGQVVEREYKDLFAYIIGQQADNNRAPPD